MRITKELKKQFEAKAQELCAEFNPYIEQSIKYAIDGTPHFLLNGKAYTKEQIDADYIETATKDIQRGFEERMVGSYDKWYRYSHADEGRAYDAGQKMASETGKCPAEFTVIEIAECNR